MSAYYYIRVGGKLVPGGYGLDNILKYELKDNLGKLKFEGEANIHHSGPKWHDYMVRNMPIEYILYNNWDVMSMTHLDLKTNDLRLNMPMLAGVSSFDIFNSGPKRIVDAMHFFYIERGKLLGSKPTRVDGDKLLGLDSWITLLPAYRIKNNGLNPFMGNSRDNSNIRSHTYDADPQCACVI